MARRAEGCASCIILSQRVDVLEGRVSVLHQIKEDEKFLDSLAILSGVNNDITCPWLGDPTHGEPVSVRPRDHLSPQENLWPKLETNPARQICSTPAVPPSEPWVAVHGSMGAKGSRSSVKTLPRLKLGNRFQGLGEAEAPSGSVNRVALELLAKRSYSSL
ncbi:hypothetical protein DPEC_G00089750 [Dallia pectoralis]|uniref:Uncharacterized protein n=1 Tax=Dallia pectoralis TaxID=75939 RepID=A0ACC2H191_DALPE|nr:hypothetical protein DPEC_G00089750 [Dallia pectoralis]